MNARNFRPGLKRHNQGIFLTLLAGGLSLACLPATLQAQANRGGGNVLTGGRRDVPMPTPAPAPVRVTPMPTPTPMPSSPQRPSVITTTRPNFNPGSPSAPPVTFSNGGARPGSVITTTRPTVAPGVYGPGINVNGPNTNPNSPRGQIQVRPFPGTGGNNSGGRSAADQLNGVNGGSNRRPGDILAGPDRLHDILFGGTVQGSIPNQPNQLGDVLFGGNPLPQKNPAAARDRFGRSQEGRDYFNGNRVRNHRHNYYGWGNAYFIDGAGYYPYYYPTYISGITYPSVYGYYYGACPPYVASNYVYNAPPTYMYVPYPVYNDNGRYQGWQNQDVDDYYLNREDLSADNRNGNNNLPDSRPTRTDAALNRAIQDIKAAWQDNQIDKLSAHIRPDSKIAVYLRGQYEYSLESGDYLDITRDAIGSTHTTRFELDDVRFKSRGIYAVSGKHVYRDNKDVVRTVYVNYVLQKIDDEYVITQVGSAPDRIQE